jgi:hypothetical protein
MIGQNFGALFLTSKSHSTGAVEIDRIAISHHRRACHSIRCDTRITNTWINRDTTIASLIVVSTLTVITAQSVNTRTTIFTWFFLEQTFVDIFETTGGTSKAYGAMHGPVRRTRSA